MFPSCRRVLVAVAVWTLLFSAGLAVAQEPSELDSINAALIEATRDPHAAVRFAAFTALVSHPRSDTLVEAFRRGLEDKNEDVQRLTMKSLIEMEGPTDLVLERLISWTKEPRMQHMAEEHLAAIGEPAVPYLLEALQQDETKAVAAAVLGRIAPSKHRAEVTQNLIDLLNDKESQVRIAAVQALAGMARLHVVSVDTKYLRYAESQLAKYDTNKDGFLSQEEWSEMPASPASADQDQDGRITLEELAGHYAPRSRFQVRGLPNPPKDR